MIENVGRNEPCPCGSGKKFKKCHGSKNTVSMEEVVDVELNAVLEKFYEINLSRNDYNDLSILITKWKSKLNQWKHEDSEQIISDYFLLMKRNDIWEKYIERQIQKAVRPSVKEVLQNWKTPIMLVGEVQNVDQDFITIKDILENKEVKLNKMEDMQAIKGDYAVGFVLPDNSKGSDVVTVLSGITFLPKWNKEKVYSIKTLYTNTDFENPHDFYKEHLLECYLLLINDSETDKPQLSPRQEKMMKDLESFLENQGILDSKILTIFAAYLMLYSPSPRKPEAVVAGAIKFAKKHFFEHDIPMSNKLLAEMFNVSTSTIQKYSDEIEVFYLTVRDKFEKPIEENEE